VCVMHVYVMHVYLMHVCDARVCVCEARVCVWYTYVIQVYACVMHVCLCVPYPTSCQYGPLKLFVKTYFSLIYTDVSYAFGMTPAASQQSTKKNYEESRTNKLTRRKLIRYKRGTDDKATKK
jgi:hypothetical protein